MSRDAGRRRSVKVRVGTMIRRTTRTEPTAKARSEAFDTALGAALDAAKYPVKADPARVNMPMLLVLLTILVIYVTMVYGPIAAMLVEMFPTRIRYTSMSLPYHIGNGWFGGFLPTTAFAIVAATGKYLLGALVSGDHRRHHAGDRHAVREGDEGRGHQRALM